MAKSDATHPMPQCRNLLYCLLVAGLMNRKSTTGAQVAAKIAQRRRAC
jgi:hypothetical protein